VIINTRTGWPKVTLGDLFEPLKRKNREGEKRVLTVSGELGLVDQSEFFDRDIASKDLSNYWLILNGEFAYNRSAMKGYPYGATKRLYRYDKGCISPIYLCFYLKDKNADANFYSYFFESGLLNQQFKSITHAGARAHGMLNVSQDEFFEMVIPKPTLKEQVKISEVILTWDRAIEVYDKVIFAKKNEYASFRQMYLTGKQRIPGFKGKWQNIKLGDVLTEHGALSSGEEEVCSVSVNKGVVNQYQHLGRVYAAADTSNYNLVKPGDIVYTKSPTGDFPFGIIKQSLTPDNVIVSPLYGVFTPVTFELGTIIDFYFESAVNARNYLRPIIQKGAKNTINITNNTFLSGVLLLPEDIAEQKVISKIIITKRGEIRLLEEIRKKYTQQKKGLMQKLLTGKIRVKGVAQ